MGDNTGIGNVKGQFVNIIEHHHYPETPKPEQSKNPKTDTALSFKSDRLPTVPGEFFGREAELALLDGAWGGGDGALLNGGADAVRAGETGAVLNGGADAARAGGDGALLNGGADAVRAGETGAVLNGGADAARAGGAGAARVVEFVAAGGTGKTKLLRHWLDRHLTEIPFLLAWSFYSQGSGEDKQVTASPFFSHAFEKLGSTEKSFPSEEDKGEHLADLLRDRRYLLALDGLEPLQHGGSGMRGELKDRALRALLKNLLSHTRGLVIISTRIAVHELRNRTPLVLSRDLHDLTEPDAVLLLKSLKVKGRDAELSAAAKEYGCHALALNLLGNALRVYLDGDVRKRDTLDDLLEDDGDPGSRHARKVMRAYAVRLEGSAELSLLRLLGLFDHPVESKVLNHLWRAEIPGLTDGHDERDLRRAHAELRDGHHMLSRHPEQPDLYDCHPLIREYFGRELRIGHSAAWRQAHELLYDYYRTGKEQPDTLAEMQPLFHAVAHGCAAGLHQRALDEVYWPRIRRGGAAFIVKQLGAFSDDLAVLAHFFSSPWSQPAAGLTADDQAAALNWAGFNLLALGRLREAIEPMRVSMDLFVEQENWEEAAINAGNLSELQLTLGDVAAAVEKARLSVDYADCSRDLFYRMLNRTTLADALHQAGDPAEAERLFREAEGIQEEREPGYPRLYSLQGFRYCDLLLTKGTEAQCREVSERATQTLAWVTTQNWLLDIALDQLTLARAHLQLADYRPAAEHSPLTETHKQHATRLLHAEHQPLAEIHIKHVTGQPQTEHRPLAETHLQNATGRPPAEHLPLAETHLQKAVAGLRSAGRQDYLPLGLLSRAAYYRVTQDFRHAEKDLAEVLEIAESGNMLLHLTDYHLESARLSLAQQAPEHARQAPEQTQQTPEQQTPKQAQQAQEQAKQAPEQELQAPEQAKQAPEQKQQTPEQARQASEQAQKHLDKAAELIKKTGYKRRLPELKSIQNKIQKTIRQ